MLNLPKAMIIFYICKNVQYIHFLFTRCEISKMESQNHLIQSFVYMYSFNVYLQNCNIWSKIISLQDNYYSA